MTTLEQLTTTPTGTTGSQQVALVPEGALWIDAPQVRRRYGGRSEMWLARKLKKDRDFPKPTYFGRLRFWRVSELDQYDLTCAGRPRTNQNSNV